MYLQLLRKKGLNLYTGAPDSPRSASEDAVGASPQSHRSVTAMATTCFVDKAIRDKEEKSQKIELEFGRSSY